MRNPIGPRSPVVTGQLSAEDRALIEQTRKTNKTLSMFVFALQERSRLTVETQLGIVDMLAALADTIRTRATQQTATAISAVIEDDSRPLALEPTHESGHEP